MKKAMMFILDTLTSRRFEILKHLKEERHPEEIAKRFAITRQAVDKHLSLLYRAGLIEKRIKEGARPMVYYRISDEGEKFVEDVEEVIENHILELKRKRKELIREMDEMLVYGKISEREYKNLRRKLEARFEWMSE